MQKAEAAPFFEPFPFRSPKPFGLLDRAFTVNIPLTLTEPFAIYI